ncbi:hypothetical protein RJ55_04052 [Drechmeria coniospora]|nr:hypothetical protein RJ55_04052 [Drechmeria coniospora]
MHMRITWHGITIAYEALTMSRSFCMDTADWSRWHLLQWADNKADKEAGKKADGETSSSSQAEGPETKRTSQQTTPCRSLRKRWHMPTASTPDSSMSMLQTSVRDPSLDRRTPW